MPNDLAPVVIEPVPAALEPARIGNGQGNGAERTRTTTERALIVIATLLVGYTLYLTSSIAVPLTVALLISLTLAPPVRALTRWYLPRSIATLLVVIAALAVVTMLGMALAEPAQSWFERMPRALQRLESGMRGLSKPLKAASDATESLLQLAQNGGSGGARPAAVVQDGPGLVFRALEQTPALLASFAAVVFLVVLFLMHGEELLRKFVAMVPSLSAKKDFVGATREAQSELSIYLMTITLINIVLGLATAGALAWLGVPDPLLWGGVAALLNYAPYVGAVLTIIVFTVVGFAEFSQPLAALAVPAAYFALNIVEGQFVTPLLVGRRLSLDPVVIFVALMVLGWIWGIAGMLLAVPILACVRIVALRAPGGATLAHLLSR